MNRGMEDCHEQPEVFGPFVTGQYSKIKKKKKERVLHSRPNENKLGSMKPLKIEQKVREASEHCNHLTR